MTVVAGLSARAISAWGASFLGSRMPVPAEELLRGSDEIRVVAGDDVHRIVPGGPPVLFVLVEGLLRVYTGSPQGRQVTLRYVSPSEVVGLPTLLAPQVVSGRMDLAVQALTDAQILQLDANLFRSMLSRNPGMAPPLFEELTGALLNAYELLVENVFQPVRKRIARHLLDLADRTDGQLVVVASQQNIADSIASVREVVSRVLLRMRDEGLIERLPDRYVLLAPAELHRIAESSD